MKLINTLSTNELTDGQLTCTYQQISTVFASLSEYFAEHGIQSDDCVVLEAENSLPSALLLLFLLEKEHPFLLSKPENAALAMPQFCRYLLQINPCSLNPSEFLTVTPLVFSTFAPKPSASFVYLRSSGSTGAPKIIAHRHEKIRQNSLNCIQRLGFSAETRVALPVPISHLFGLGVGFLPAVILGAAIDFQKGANLIRYLQREKVFNPNTALMTPIFCETLSKGRKTARPYRLTVIAGDCLRSSTFNSYEALFGCVVQLYGSTEMGAIAAGNPADSSHLRSQFIGLPMPDVQMKLLTVSDQTLDAAENSGELACKRQFGFDACLDQQGAAVNLSQLDAQGWLATKDLGQLSSDGYIKVLGRCDYSVKRDGLLVLFSDVELALQSIEGVASAAVVTHGESLRGKGLVAFCVIEDQTLTTEHIRARCFDLLPRRAIPDQVLLIAALPLLSNGKIDRLSLVKQLEKS